MIEIYKFENFKFKKNYKGYQFHSLVPTKHSKVIIDLHSSHPNHAIIFYFIIKKKKCLMKLKGPEDE